MFFDEWEKKSKKLFCLFFLSRALIGLSVRSLHQKSSILAFFSHLFPLPHKIIPETICTGSKITCCLALAFCHLNLSLCLSLSVLELLWNHTGSKSMEGGKTEHSNVRGLWTSQMHSVRPLIKIISTGDGRGEKKKTRKMKAQLGRCKISFLLFNLSGTEAGNTPIILLEHRAPSTGIFILEGHTRMHKYKHTQAPSSAKEGQRGH